MLLHSETIRLESSAPPAAMLDALRKLGAEWRESKLSPAARASGIIGWKVRVQDDHFVIRARIGGQNGSLPHFVGSVRSTSNGSVIDGELRMSWLPRLFTLTWLALVGGAPVIALFEPIPGAGFGEHVLMAVLMILPAAALFAFGLWITRRGWSRPAIAFRDLLVSLCKSSHPLEHVESTM